jgi:hypothetical protein
LNQHWQTNGAESESERFSGQQKLSAAIGPRTTPNHTNAKAQTMAQTQRFRNGSLMAVR